MGEVLKVYKTITDNQAKIATWNQTKNKALEKVREELLKEKREWDETKKKLSIISN